MSDLLAPELLLAAAAGGAFGAAVGALPSFSLAGLVVVLGEVHAALHRELAGAAPALDVTGEIGFGVVLGPHVAFGGGAAAAAYAARRGVVPETEDFAYHDAKAIARGLGTRPDVLAVGGCFGALGYLLAGGAVALGLPTDPVALGVVGSAVCHRLAFGYDLVGAPAGRLLDMSPYERGERRSVGPSGGAGDAVAADGGTSECDGASEGAACADTTSAGADTAGRLRVEPWLPHQYRWSHVAGIGAVGGVLGAYVAHLTGSAFLAFGLSAASLAFLCAGVERIPVTHHVTLPASTVVLAAAGLDGSVAPGTVAGAVPLGDALLLGVAAGVAGALLGEVAQRALYAHADTHLDPPAASIVLTTLAIGLLAAGGVLPSSAWVPV